MIFPYAVAQVTALTFSHLKLPMISPRPSTSNFTHIFPSVPAQYLSTTPQLIMPTFSPLHLPHISPTSSQVIAYTFSPPHLYNTSLRSSPGNSANVLQSYVYGRVPPFARVAALLPPEAWTHLCHVVTPTTYTLYCKGEVRRCGGLGAKCV